MPKVFSRQTLEKFEAASASIPIRQLDQAFENANIRLGMDPGGPDGARRAQFRRYIAGVDQHDPRVLERLGNALGALIAEVATSKQAFLVSAAEADGFVFAAGAFRPARGEDFPQVADRGRRLQLLANERPKDALAGASELVESVCRTVLRLIDVPAPKKTADLPALAKTTLAALEAVPAGGEVAGLAVVIETLGGLRRPSSRHARLAVGVAVALAGFIAETYAERVPSPAGKMSS